MSDADLTKSSNDSSDKIGPLEIFLLYALYAFIVLVIVYFLYFIIVLGDFSELFSKYFFSEFLPIDNIDTQCLWIVCFLCSAASVLMGGMGIIKTSITAFLIFFVVDLIIGIVMTLGGPLSIFTLLIILGGISISPSIIVIIIY